jgi:hypothetical protein
VLNSLTVLAEGEASLTPYKKLGFIKTGFVSPRSVDQFTPIFGSNLNEVVTWNQPVSEHKSNKKSQKSRTKKVQGEGSVSLELFLSTIDRASQTFCRQGRFNPSTSWFRFETAPVSASRAFRDDIGTNAVWSHLRFADKDVVPNSPVAIHDVAYPDAKWILCDSHRLNRLSAKWE